MFVQAVGLAQDAFKVVPVHCFLKFLLETETPILFSDYQLMGHNGKRGKGYFDTDFPSENNNPIVILLLSFSFGVSEVHCF
jgi:hypothetical protein